MKSLRKSFWLLSNVGPPAVLTLKAVADFAVKRWGIETAATGSSHDMSYASDMDGHFGLRIGLRHEYFSCQCFAGAIFFTASMEPGDWHRTDS